jgi:hypothetical protein
MTGKWTFDWRSEDPASLVVVGLALGAVFFIPWSACDPTAALKVARPVAPRVLQAATPVEPSEPAAAPSEPPSEPAIPTKPAARTGHEGHNHP